MDKCLCFHMQQLKASMLSNSRRKEKCNFVWLVFICLPSLSHCSSKSLKNNTNSKRSHGGKLGGSWKSHEFVIGNLRPKFQS